MIYQSTNGCGVALQEYPVHRLIQNKAVVGLAGSS